MWSPKSTEADQVGQGLEQPGLVSGIPAMARGLELDNLKFLSNPSHSMTLYAYLLTSK